MKEIETNLIKIGFSQHEAKIYEALQGILFSSVSNLADITGLSRNSIYAGLKSLEKMGLVTVFTKHKRKVYAASDPENIRNFLNSKMSLFQSLLPTLQAVRKEDKKTNVFFYRGLEGIRNSFIDNLNSYNELLTIAGESTFNDFIIKEHPEYIKERIRKKILLKLIVPDSEVMRKWKKTDAKDLRLTKLITNNIYPLQVNIDIYNNRVVMTSLEEMVALVIENKAIADSMRSVFYLIWDNINDNTNN